MPLAACGGAVGLMLSIAVPPPQFDCAYPGKLTVIEVPVLEVHGRCGGAQGTARRIFACARPKGMECEIVLPKVEPGGVTRQQQARLRRHEEGHCRGWGADHVGGSYSLFGRR